MKTFIRILLASMMTLMTSMAAFGAEAVEHQYLIKIDQFGQLTDHQMAMFSEYVRESSTIQSETQKSVYSSLELQQKALWIEIANLKDLYNKSFILKTATREERQALVTRESNLSIAIHRQLLLVHDYLKSVPERNDSDKKLVRLSSDLSVISNDLLASKPISVPASMGINQVFQAGRKLSLTLCKMVAGFCTRKSLSELMDGIDETRFLRNAKFEYSGHEVLKETLAKNPKAVFILIGNHDQPLMDISLARKVALMLGSDHHMTMTRKSVYPIPPPEKAGDVVFVVDNDPKANPVQKSLDLLTENILTKNKSRVSLAVYPEGMLPYTGGQMPMTVKEGAFVIARKMAVQMREQGIPVFLVQMKSNIIEHLTATETIPAKVVLESITKVPDDALGKGDAWIEAMRVRAENSFNSHRAKTQIDIFNLDKVPYSKIPYGMEMRKCSKIFIL